MVRESVAESLKERLKNKALVGQSLNSESKEQAECLYGDVKPEVKVEAKVLTCLLKA